MKAGPVGGRGKANAYGNVSRVGRPSKQVQEPYMAAGASGLSTICIVEPCNSGVATAIASRGPG